MHRHTLCAAITKRTRSIHYAISFHYNLINIEGDADIRRMLFVTEAAVHKLCRCTRGRRLLPQNIQLNRNFCFGTCGTTDLASVSINKTSCHPCISAQGLSSVDLR